MKSFSSRLTADRRLFAPGAAARPRDLATELRSAPRLEARPCPPVPPAPSTPVRPVADMRFGASSRSPASPRRHPPVPRPGPVDQAVRFLETPVAFARSCLCGVETAITFAGENRAVLVRLLVAVVTVVSTGAVQGRAVVMGVSCWPASVAAEVSLVSKSPRGCVLCARKFALRGLVVGVSAKKFALRAHNGPKLAFSGVLGELFRGNAAEGAVRGEFFRANRPCAQVL